MALKFASLANKFSSLKTSNNIKLGLSGRTGSERAAKMAQIDLDGNPLTDVSEQVAELFIDKGFAKHKASFVKGLGVCVVVENVPTGTTGTEYLPLPMKKVEEFKTPIANWPKSITNKATKTMAPDFELVKLSEDGKGTVVAKAVEKDGSWLMAKYDRPIYKQYVNGYGEVITTAKANGEARVGVKTDEEGNYVETFSKNAYCALGSYGLFPAQAVSASGTKIAGSEGIYIVAGSNDDSLFAKVKAAASAGKFSIKSMLKVLTHPTFGIASNSDLTSAGALKKGRIKIDTTACKIQVFDGNNVINDEFSKLISDRPAFKLGKFRAVGVRAGSLEEAVLVENRETKKEIAKAIITEDADDIF